ncbi:MAG: bifunctional phosphoribosylaminoimidazolecarboxamide formyltransferase/IMP cyclohydrolase, partial [Candidatus Omnitrophica bacterium]|nr:bifunctional phosphoribosylaminoimidazolecarboxamide formyltransferase/IMP cyclohydrolase [Candidatus Omnitrophota bacterium]
LKEKKNLRIIELPNLTVEEESLDLKKVDGGLLFQEKDTNTLDQENLKVVSQKRPTKKQWEDLIFAWKVVKHVKSNAIVIAKDKKTLGIGAGQMSRVDSAFIAIRKAKTNKFNLEGASLASDAFFPKEDAVILACRNKIKAIIQPGGSVEDEKIIRIVDKYKIAMVFTGIRHFKH